MSANTHIQWTEATWNPVLGCAKISPGCRGCYAINHVHRMAGNPNQKIASANSGLTIIEGGRPNWTGKVRLIPERLDIPLRKKKPTMYFVNSLSDLFHEYLTFEEIRRVHLTMLAGRQHTYQILTKRPERMADYFRWWFGGADVAKQGTEPAPWIWLGASVESRDCLWRINYLRRTPAVVRFLSLEPLLEDLGQLYLTGIHWVIVGGESGKNARPMHPTWVRNVHEQCVAAGVPFFFKQWGEWAPAEREPHMRLGKKAAGRLFDGRTWDEVPGREIRREV